MTLKEEKYKAVPKNYKGVVRLQPSKAYLSRYWHVYVKLQKGYHYSGNPDHRVVIKLYKTYQDLTNNGSCMGEAFVEERKLYVPRKRKNNYW
jgi:hypothetical protein